MSRLTELKEEMEIIQKYNDDFLNDARYQRLSAEYNTLLGEVTTCTVMPREESDIHD